MATFEVDIRGAKYEIEAPDEQQAATWALKLAQQPQHFELGQAPGQTPPPGMEGGVMPYGVLDRSPIDEAGTGMRQALEAIPGMGGDLYNLAVAGLHGAASGMPGFVHRGIDDEFQGKNWLPTSEDVARNITDPILGEKPDEPLTSEGQIGRTIGNFGLGMFAPGGPMRKAASVLFPALGSEGAGRAAEGTDLEPYARLIGGLAGGAATIPRIGAASTVKAGARELGVQAEDMTRLIKRMQQDGLTPQQIQQRLGELGPDATLMDVGPNLRQEGQRIYAKGGEGRGVIDSALTPRDTAANARIRGEVDQTIGPAPVPSHVETQIGEGQAALSQVYENALANATRVDTTRIANQLEGDAVNLRGRAQQAVQRIRGMLDITGTNQLDPNPRTLFETRKAIDGLIATETDPNALRVLNRTRADVDRELARAVPGIKDVDAQFSELARQRDALGRGQQVLESGRTAPRPQELADEFQQGALPQGTQVGPSAAPMRLRQGARAEIERIIGTNANDRVALQRLIKGEGDWNRDRLATLFGQDRADRLISVLDRERTFAETSNRVMKNSATAERLPEGGAGGMTVKDAFSAGGPKAIVYSGLVKGAEAVIDKMRGAAAAARDERMSRILTNTNAQQIVTSLLRANGGKPLRVEQLEPQIRALLQAPGVSAQERR